MIIEEVYRGEPLHGNMENFLKDKSDQKMKTNYLGAECVTQPDLCENGFSVKFVMEGMDFSFIVEFQMILRIIAGRLWALFPMLLGNH